MNKKAIASLIICGMLIVPSQVDAKGFSSGGRSVSSSRSFSSSSSKSFSSGSKSFSSGSKSTVSKSSGSLFKSSSKSSSKPFSLKLGKSTLKPKSSKTIPRVNKVKTTNKSNVKKIDNKKVDLSKKSQVKKTTVKVDSGMFKVKPRPKTSSKKYKPKHYKSYNNTVVYYPVHSNNSFLEFYMLTNLFDNDDDVTERDIVRELESRGYSQSEIDDILYEGRQEQQRENKDFKYEEKKSSVDWASIFGGTLMAGSIGGIIYMLVKARKR